MVRRRTDFRPARTRVPRRPARPASWAPRQAAALFNTIAATVTAGYIVAHPAASVLTAQVHGFNVAMAWGVLVLLAAAIPIVLFVNAPASAASPDELRALPDARRCFVSRI
jgi:hypothetical protein